jgi:tetratricopeptide (TPR) repeat protein
MPIKAAFTASLIAILAPGATGCSTLGSVFGADAARERAQPPIHNPFPDYYASSEGSRENIILRTKQGDRAVEVELPQGQGQLSDLVVPMSPRFDGGRAPASDIAPPGPAADRAPSIADREITGRLASGTFGREGDRREIEGILGVVPAEDALPERDTSYLAALDQVKQLYRTARYEAALLALDDLLKLYPTDPRLYEMRGTLFDRIGQPDLAIKSWNQALRLEPSNAPLRRYVERKQQRRGLASP